jgi:multiple sugar transport system permease protein
VTTTTQAPPGQGVGLAAGIKAKAGRRRDFVGASQVTPYLFLAPYLVLFTVFVLVPVFLGLWISLHNWDQFLDHKPWVGFDNYGDLFDGGSPTGSQFWQGMRATALFTVLSVPLLVTVPLAVALLLNRRFAGRNVFRAVFFAPYVLGVAVVGLLWRFLLDPNIGVLNFLLDKVGLPDKTGWTTAEPWVWVSLVGMTLWWTLGFNAIIYLAGLQEIPRDLYKAATVDGAGPWQQFRHVTLPGLRRVFLFVLTVTILASAHLFGQSFLVTQGAPGNRTRTAIMYIAEQGFRNFRLGSAAAMSYVLALFLMAVSGLTFFLFRNQARED